MSLIKRIKFKIRFFLSKRIIDINKAKFEIVSTWKGNRKKTKAFGTPINLHGKEHIHPYVTTACPYSCYYCQNLFYVDKHKKIPEAHPFDLANLLNRMYNFNHIDIQGGEPMIYYNGQGLVMLLNQLYNHNIVVFTHNPHKYAENWHLVSKGRKNNIMIYVTYHHLEEERKGRSIHQFIRDFNKIPKWMNPVCSAVITREVSYKNIRALFAARGIYLVNSEVIEPTQHNKVKDTGKSVMCRNSMACISPDLKVYRCPGLMFHDIDGLDPDQYNWENKAQSCDHYGLCGPITTAKDFAEREQ